MLINFLNANPLSIIMYCVFCFIGGAVIAFFLTRYMFNKQLKENPPISEAQIRAMFASMGQKPNEARIQQVLKSMGITPSSTPKPKKQPYVKPKEEVEKKDGKKKK